MRSFFCVLAVIGLALFSAPAFAGDDGSSSRSERRISSLERRVSELEEEASERDLYRTAALGAGISFAANPQPGPQPGPLVAVMGQYSFVSGFYYPGMGGGGAMNLHLDIGRLRLSPLGFGAMLYHDRTDVMNARWLNRGVDLVVPVSARMRLWRGLAVSAQLSWFLPNPVTVSSAGRDAGQAASADQPADDALAIPTEASVTRRVERRIGTGDLNEYGEVVSTAYTDAINEPRIELIVQWTF